MTSGIAHSSQGIGQVVSEALLLAHEMRFPLREKVRPSRKDFHSLKWVGHEKASVNVSFLPAYVPNRHCCQDWIRDGDLMSGSRTCAWLRVLEQP